MYPYSIALVTTDKCNLNCKYCYYQKNAYTTEIDIEKAKKILDYIIKNRLIYNKTEIILIGGEPLLLKKEKLSEIIGFIHKNKKYFNSNLNTNGILLPKQDLKTLRKLDVICISIDGKEETHNKNRNNSFKQVEYSINWAKKNKLAIMLNKVINSDNYDSLYEDFRYLYEKFKVPINIIPQIDDNNWNPEKISILKKEYSKIFEYLKRFPVKILNEHFSNFFKIHIFYCPFYKLTIGPDNLLYNCEILSLNRINELDNIDYFGKKIKCKYNILDRKECINETCLTCKTYCQNKVKDKKILTEGKLTQRSITDRFRKLHNIKINELTINCENESDIDPQLYNFLISLNKQNLFSDKLKIEIKKCKNPDALIKNLYRINSKIIFRKNIKKGLEINLKNKKIYYNTIFISNLYTKEFNLLDLTPKNENYITCYK